MAPEQASGREVTPATDLYSLGVIAWEMLAGRVPFEEADSPVAVLYQHAHEPVPSIRTAAPGVDERLASWLSQMLAKEPADRFAAADAAWDALEDVVLELIGPRWRRDARLLERHAEAQASPLSPATFDEPTPRRPPRDWRRLGLVATALVALVGGAIGAAVALGGGASASGQLTTILGRLAQARSRGIAELRAATTPAQQAVAASRIASAYASAGQQVHAKPLLRADLTSAAGAYAELASAARSRNRAGYNRARLDIRADELRLRSATSRP